MAVNSGPPIDAVSLQTPTGTLSGTLVSAGKIPALIIAGSGPTDRDGNSNLNLHSNVYKMLAEGLAKEGISTLRYDKRGVGASRAAMTAEQDLRFQTYVDDAKGWAHTLSMHAGGKPVWLVGHSEGALIAEKAAEHNAEVCGLVLISGAGRKAADILRKQLGTSLPESLKQQAFDGLSELENGRTILAPSSPELMGVLRPSVQPYLISWLPLDPAAILAGLKQPVLIMQGDADVQVSVEDAKRLAAARSDAHLVILKGVNHVLKTAPLERAANMATYNNPDLPLGPGVLDTVAHWIKGHTCR
jgi:pimeloyl-ACP methyl ester carboxylesterase